MDVSITQLTKNDDRKTLRSLLLGIAVWFVHQNVIYGLASLACKWGWLSFHIAGIPALQVVETLISLAAMGVMIYLIYVPWKSWRRFQTEKPTDNPHLLHDTEKERRPLAAFIAMMLNSFFLLFIIGSFVIIFALNACRQG